MWSNDGLEKYVDLLESMGAGFFKLLKIIGPGWDASDSPYKK